MKNNYIFTKIFNNLLFELLFDQLKPGTNKWLFILIFCYFFNKLSEFMRIEIGKYIS